MTKFLKFYKELNIAELYIKVKTSAKENSFRSTETYNDREYLGLSIKAAPIDGKANKMIVSFLSKTLSVPRKNIKIIRGEHSRFKTVRIIDSEIEKSDFTDSM